MKFVTICNLYNYVQSFRFYSYLGYEQWTLISIHITIASDPNVLNQAARPPVLEPQTAGAGLLIILLNIYSSLPYDIKQKSSSEILVVEGIVRSMRRHTSRDDNVRTSLTTALQRNGRYSISRFLTNFCVKPYELREHRSDPSNRRLYEHGILYMTLPRP